MMKISGRITTIDRTPIYIGEDSLASVDRFISTMHLGGGGIYILVDHNTRQYCLPVAVEKSGSLAGARVVEIDGGEDSKTVAAAEKLWIELLSAGAGRNSLLVNLGGGVVSDLGGFVAAGFKRGINYINIPTTLMGQADAAIGGKTSVNIGKIKNQVGFFHAAQGVFIFPGFLKTLPKEQLRSGLAEIIKSALIGNVPLWNRIRKHPVAEILNMPIDHPFWQEVIQGTVKFKNKVIVHDYREKKFRKILNFGHTVGHALETCSYMGSRQPLLHGEAVAMGMVCSAFLSVKKTGLEISDMEEIRKYIFDGYGCHLIDQPSKSWILEAMMHDKKAVNGQIRFTLLAKPGFPVINVLCERKEIEESFEFFNTTLTGWGNSDRVL